MIHLILPFILLVVLQKTIQIGKYYSIVFYSLFFHKASLVSIRNKLYKKRRNFRINVKHAENWKDNNLQCIFCYIFCKPIVLTISFSSSLSNFLSMGFAIYTEYVIEELIYIFFYTLLASNFYIILYMHYIANTDNIKILSSF